MKWWAFLAMLCCAVFAAIGQLFFKLGAMALPALFTNWQLFIGLLCYGFGLFLFVLAMRGGDVSVLYPVLASSYILTNILAIFFLNEQISVLSWAGIAGIILGISLIGWGEK